MGYWEISTENSISVISSKILNLKAFYVLESSSAPFTEITGPFNKYDNRYEIKHTFNIIGRYIIKIIDVDGLINVQHKIITVSDNVGEMQIGLDSYSNKDNWKGLTSLQEIKLTDTNILINTINTELGNISGTINTLPTLVNIENSSIIAKKADISIVENICSQIPVLSDIRNELINVTFGGLEIANNQLTIKDKDGVIIAIFDLFDRNGNPTMASVYKRTVV